METIGCNDSSKAQLNCVLMVNDNFSVSHLRQVVHSLDGLCAGGRILFIVVE